MAQDERVSVDLYIDGEWRPARSAARFDLIDPAREEIVGTAARAGAEDTRDAIAAAVRGFEVWRRTPAWERSRMLRRIAVLLGERAEHVARQLTIETGKTIAISRGEVQSTVETLEWFADEARRIYGQVVEGRTPASSSSPATSRSGSSAPSPPGISRSRWWRENSPRRWPPAARSSSARPRKARLRWRC